MENPYLLSDNLDCGMQNARKALTSLGVTANYTGFDYAAFAVALALEDSKRLRYITKWIYPDVARQYGTSTACVERCIRTISRVSWERNPELLGEMAQYPLSRRPVNAAFLAILTTYLSCGQKVF